MQVDSAPRIPLRLQRLFLGADRPPNHQKPSDQIVASPVKRSLISSPIKKSSGTKGALTTKLNRSSSTGSSSSTTARETKKYSGARTASKTPSLRKSPRKRCKKKIPSLSPQDYLDGLLLNRSYSIERYDTHATSPTALQVVSHSMYVVEAAKRDPEKLRSLLQAGLSPNSCNVHGDSLLNMVCRRGLVATLQVMADCGARFDLCRGNGLTPLHEACWVSPPDFKVIDIVLRHATSRAFLAKDRNGFVPLQYTTIDDWDSWLRFLESRKNTYWPEGGNGVANQSDDESMPQQAMPMEVASLLAKGQIQPEDVWMFLDQDVSSSSDYSSDNDLSTDDITTDDDDNDCDYDDDDESMSS